MLHIFSQFNLGAIEFPKIAGKGPAVPEYIGTFVRDLKTCAKLIHYQTGKAMVCTDLEGKMPIVHANKKRNR